MAEFSGRCGGSLIVAIGIRYVNGMAPRLLITLGDVAGIGPEIVAKAWPWAERVRVRTESA